MFPAIAQRSANRNAHVFSPCSAAAIKDVLAAKGGCLEEAHPCAGAGSKAAKNPNSAQACCLGNTFLPAGVVCRPLTAQEQQCKVAGVCSGDAATCPEVHNRADGTPCAFLSEDGRDGAVLGHGTCINGLCTHIHDGFCADLGLFGCSLPQAECAVACAGSRGGECRPYSPDCRDLMLRASPTAATAVATTPLPVVRGDTHDSRASGVTTTARTTATTSSSSSSSSSAATGAATAPVPLQPWLPQGRCPLPRGAPCASQRGFVGVCTDSGACACEDGDCTTFPSDGGGGGGGGDGEGQLECDFLVRDSAPCSEPCNTGKKVRGGRREMYFTPVGCFSW